MLRINVYDEGADTETSNEKGSLSKMCPPIFNAELILPKRGKAPVSVDNRAVREWLGNLEVFSYTQLAELSPRLEDIFTGCSYLDGSASSRLPYSKSLLFTALTGMDHIHKDAVKQMYEFEGRIPSDRYISYATSIIQACSMAVLRYKSELEKLSDLRL